MEKIKKIFNILNQNQIIMKKKFLLLMSLVFALVISSCSKDEKSPEEWAEEDKQTLENLSDGASADMNEMLESNGMDALMALMDIMGQDDPFYNEPVPDAKTRYKSTFTPFGEKDEKQKSTLKIEQNWFEEHAGTYTWNVSTQKWDYSSEPTDKILLVFPENGPEGADNNVTITLHDFEEEWFEDEWSSWTQPTALHMDMFIDGTKEGELLFSASYHTNGEPQNLSIDLFLNPIHLDLSFDDSGTQFSAAGSLKLHDLTILSADLTIDYIIVDDEGWEYEEITFVQGFVHYGPIKVQGSMDIAELDALDYPAVADDINPHIDLTLYSYPDGRKMADIVAKDDPASGEPVPYLIFPDGSEEPALPYIMPILEDFQQQLSDLMGEPVLR